MHPPPPLLATAAELGQILTQQQCRLASVESCTGGGIGYVVTALSGSSAWFDRAYVTYSNAAKTELGVPAELLENHGAVSEQVARAMATRGQQRSTVEYCVAVTGIAGPQGGSAQKPVGTVCFAWLRHRAADFECRATTQYFHGDRHAIRHAAIQHALRGLLELATSD